MSRTRLRLLWPAIQCLFMLSAASDAIGAASLDQSFEPASFDAPYAIFGPVELAQTFTVGATGKLVTVDVFVSNLGFEPLLFDVRPTIGGIPQMDNQSALVSRSAFPPFNVEDDWYRFDFTDTPVSVSSGDVLAIVLRSPTTPSCMSLSWPGNWEGGYLGGKGVGRDVSVSQQWAGPGMSDLGDLGFRTFVVPEPSSYMLLCAGALALLAYAKCHKTPRSVD